MANTNVEGWQDEKKQVFGVPSDRDGDGDCSKVALAFKGGDERCLDNNGF